MKRNRPIDEVIEAFQSMRTPFNNLFVKHEKYTQMIADDETFEKEEKWLEECQDFYLEMEISPKDHSKAASESGKLALEGEPSGLGGRTSEFEVGESEKME